MSTLCIRSVASLSFVTSKKKTVEGTVYESMEAVGQAFFHAMGRIEGLEPLPTAEEEAAANERNENEDDDRDAACSFGDLADPKHIVGSKGF